MRHAMRLFPWLIMLGLGAILRDDGPHATPGEAPAVEFAGCGAVHAGPVCELSESAEINVWAEVPEGAIVDAWLDGRRIAMRDQRESSGGVQFRLRLSGAARKLVITIEKDGERARFRLPLRPRAPVPVIEEAVRLHKSGQVDAATRLLEGALDESPDPAMRARLLSRLARIALGRGEIPKTITRLQEAIRLHRAAGRISDEAEDGMTLAYTHIFHGRDFAAARSALNAVSLLEPSYPEGRALAAYYAALLAIETGDFRRSLSLLRLSSERAERLGITKLRLTVMQLQADVLRRMGRVREAEALLAHALEALPSSTEACQRASLLNDVGYNAILSVQSGTRSVPKLDGAFSALGQALDLYAQGGPCPTPRRRANVLVNLALASLYRGATEEARDFVARARDTFPAADARMKTEWTDIEGRIHLAEGHLDRALKAYDELAELAVEPEGRFIAALGRARALAALGQWDAGAEEYARAHALLADRSLLVPLSEGRGAFFGWFEESAREHVDLLLDRDPRAALEVARRARRQMLAALQWSDRLERSDGAARARWEDALSAYRNGRLSMAAEALDDWKLPSDEWARVTSARRAREQQLLAVLDEALASLGLAGEGEDDVALPSPGEGELVLAYFPVRAGLAGFALTRDGVAARRLGPVDTSAPPEALAAAMFAPFEDQIRRARRIRVVSHGTLERIDVHALPWKDGPLLAHAPVVYGVDIPVRGEGSVDPQAPREGEALVVGDPRGDLPAARREAEMVALQLGPRGFRVRELYSQQAAHGALREALEGGRVALFHYAGHGLFGGRDGWESALPLAGGGTFSVSDVLSLARAPRHVVLSGCDTGRTEAGVPVEGLGLGQAFIVAGSASVVATARPVEDDLAEAVMTSFYRALGSDASKSGDAANQLREAVLHAARERRGSDWASFRVLVP
ncbi:CHAT domain-containing protein [Polyangium aurulentum]|uniref:CHAT domain-containing protein n=1 Tax=Polyangium aurulentum TaxID=2567896 RepID=UPI0010AE9DDE|nr:CHAT domain-containing protein [Polyangium aurulentum]UQA62783.1 CHAT domain-containing protein [Polyangium aurulentum]